MNTTENFLNRTYRYTRALSRWIKAGRPVRSEEEIARIFETFCNQCEDYDAGTCRCCGCRVNLLAAAPLNKIAMATEECPLEKWRKHTMNKIVKQPIIATRENTVFMIVAAYSDHESQTEILRKSADDYGISLIFCDVGDPWQGFYHHKIKKMSNHLKRFQQEGKHFAFILDCRDVVFIKSVDTVLETFNAFYDGRVIFNNDMPTEAWPSCNDYLTQAVEDAMNDQYARLNAGAIAGDIETILKIQHLAMNIRREMKEGRPRHRVLETIYQNIGANHLDDDQYLYQLCLIDSPELFRTDDDKELFAVLMSYPHDIDECSDDPRRHDVINNAAIIHSPWLSHSQEWRERVFQKRWER